MRYIILLITATLLAWPPIATAQQSAQARAAALYQKGLTAVKAGEAATAESCFREVLRLQPRNANARFQLHQLKLNAPALGAKKRKLQLQKILLAKVEFEDLSLREALDTLDALVLKATKEEFAPNFIVQDSANILGERTFSLQLSNIPASVALQYCLDHARASARYDQHAIVVKPHPKTGATTSRPNSPTGTRNQGGPPR